jgi:calcium-dependent protein kinase
VLAQLHSIRQLCFEEAEMCASSSDIVMAGCETDAFVTDGKFEDFYDIDIDKLGEGSFGFVTTATNKYTGAVCAVKPTPKDQVDNCLFREHDIMKSMHHPNIIKFRGTFHDHQNIYLVMDYCSGGDLFDRIIDAGHFEERQGAILMQQLFQAVSYCHARNVCHRDLKPENILLTSRDMLGNDFLKIADFGLSRTFSENQVLTTKLGSPHFVSPQVLLGRYDQLCDTWSCGVIMYMVLCGCQPFTGVTDMEVLSKVRRGSFSFSMSLWTSVSGEAKALIRKLLEVNPRYRCAADQALQSDWIMGHGTRQAASDGQIHENSIGSMPALFPAFPMHRSCAVY